MREAKAVRRDVGTRNILHGIVVGLLVMPSAALAATISVKPDQTAITADGQCSLREAIINANNDAATHADCVKGAGADIIELPAGTYTVDQGGGSEDFSAEGDLDIRADITISGAGAATTVIQGAASRDNAIDRVVHVIAGATATLNDLTVRNGRAPNGTNATGCSEYIDCRRGAVGQSGGGILNEGTLTINRVTVDNNRAGDGGNGATATCTESSCDVGGGSGGNGGGLFSRLATVTIRSSTISNNEAGVAGLPGVDMCTEPAFCDAGTGSDGGGGGLFGGTSTVIDSLFSANTSQFGGAIQQNIGVLTISDTVFSGNIATISGGAIICNSGSEACTIAGSSFNGNSASHGGAIIFYNGGVKTVTNSTITGNTALNDGGGISAVSGPLNLNFVTIAANVADSDKNGGGDGGGLNRSSATVTVKNSIIADNMDTGGQAHDISGTITSAGYNHIERTTGGTITTTAGDVTGSDPGLEALADNGGRTQTRALALSSVALDTIPVGTNGCQSGTGAVLQDQRGASRATDSDGNGSSGCDKGAVEMGGLRCGIQAASEPFTHTYLSGPNAVAATVTNDGSNFDCLRVTDIAINHPSAPTTLQTGKYWIVKTLQSDRTTAASNDYTIDLALPFATADESDEVCGYTGTDLSWDCDATSFKASSSITRVGINNLTYWAVNNVSACGTGITGAGEQCDAGAANGTPESCCSATCTFVSAGSECRAASAVCDSAETCTGASGACPANSFASSGVCRSANGACDAAESCNGSGPDCPSDEFAKGTQCRAAEGICDVAETCDGSGVNCPADGFAAGIECRASAGACDVAETCDGAGASCPSDGFATGTECRASAGDCDVAETCDGSGAACPSDGFATGTECRASAGVCDVAESCDGSGATCPPDGFATGTECRASAGVCDVAESCDGSGASCPSDAFADATTVCRSAATSCDAAESCSGSSATCPLDVAVKDGTSCDDGDACTENESCSTGTCGDGTTTAACNPGAVCSTTPASGCATASGNTLRIADTGKPKGRSLRWVWSKGNADFSDFGDPTTTTEVRLCVYDDGVLVTQVGAGAVEGWTTVDGRYIFGNQNGNSEGLTKLVMSERNGTGRIKLSAKGIDLVTPTLPLNNTGAVTVQLVKDAASGSECWESVLSAPARRNSANLYRDQQTN